jgi:hypothetical protein
MFITLITPLESGTEIFCHDTIGRESSLWSHPSVPVKARSRSNEKALLMLDIKRKFCPCKGTNKFKFIWQIKVNGKNMCMQNQPSKPVK